MEDRVVSTAKKTMDEIKHLKDSVKKFYHDLGNLYILVKNIETSLANEDDESESQREEDDVTRVNVEDDASK